MSLMVSFGSFNLWLLWQEWAPEASVVISDVNFPGRMRAPRHILVLGKEELNLRVRTRKSDTGQHRALYHKHY